MSEAEHSPSGAGEPSDETETSDERRLFVGVGNKSYEHLERLDNAITDVNSLAALLGEQEFGSIPLHDKGRDELRTTLNEELRVDDFRPDGVLVVYWAGHAIAGDDGLMLLARDDERDSPSAIRPSELAAYAVRTGASQILILLDTCYSAAGLVDVFAMGQAVYGKRVDDGQRWLGVVASSRAHELAADGVFGETLIHVLRNGPADSSLRIRWNAYQAGVRGDDVIEAIREAWDRDEDQSPQWLSTLGARPIFRNPFFDADAPDQVVEHLLWSARGADRGEAGNWFSGRSKELAQIVAWINGGEPGLLAVTGAAGTGKSAVVGRIVSLSSLAERAEIHDASGLPVGALDPGARSVDAHVQLRGATLDSVARALSAALGINREKDRPTHHHVLAWAAETREAVPTLVFDGLDEAAEHAHPIAVQLLGPLAEYAQVLVATRRGPEDTDGRDLVENLTGATVLDVGANQQALHGAIRAYVGSRLSMDGAWIAPAMDPQLVAEHVVATVASDAARGSGDGPFLLARLLTSQLRDWPVDTNSEDWRSRLAASVEEALTRDLASSRPLLIDGEPAPEAASLLLTALAFSYGSGVPVDDVWPAIATALAPDAVRFDRDAAYWALEEHGRYVTAAGLRGQAVFRLHQRLGETLIDAHGGGDEARGAVSQAVLDVYERELRAGAAAANNPYLWIYAWQHAVDGGRAGVDRLAELALLDPSLEPDVPIALEALSQRLAVSGRRNEAIEVASAAVTRLEKLTADAPDYTPALANSLTNLSARLGEIGQHQHALPPAQRAAALLEQLAAENRAFLPGLASALGNLGIRLGQVGERLGALPPTQRAVTIYDELAAENPAYLPNLAGNLGNLGTKLSEVGDRLGALAPTQRSLEIYEQLATDNPAYIPEFAGHLGNLGNRLSQIGRYNDALPPTERAVELYERISASNPSHLPDLARTLGLLGVRLSQTGDRIGALAPTERAVELYESLAADNPGYLAGLAGNLGNLGNRLSEVGDHVNALPATRRAVDVYEDLAAENPGYLPELAGHLGNLGNRLSDVGARFEALGPTRRAVELYETLASDNSGYLPGLARTLDNLGVRLGQSGAREQASAPAMRAVALYKELAATNPGFLPSLAGALGNLGIRLNEVGDHQQALAATRRSIAIYDELAADNPAHLPGLAGNLSNLGTQLSTAGNRHDAIPPIQRAIGIYEELVGLNTGFRDNHARALANLGRRLSAVDRHREAVDSTQNAIDLFETLAADNRAFIPNLAGALSDLGDQLRRSGDVTGALAPTRRAADLYEGLVIAERTAAMELAITLNRLEVLGGARETDARWRRLLELVSTEDPAAVLIRLKRWRPAEKFHLAVADCMEAARFAEETDPALVAATRKRVRELFSFDPDAFGAVWDGLGGTVEPWMTIDADLIRLTRDWVVQPDWAVSKRWLEEHPGYLTEDSIDVALAEVALAVPAVDTSTRLQLLDVARSKGIDAAYERLLPLDRLVSWLKITDPTEAGAFLELHAGELLTDAVNTSIEVKSSSLHSSLLIVATRFGVDSTLKLIGNSEGLDEELKRARREDDAEVIAGLAGMAGHCGHIAAEATSWLHLGIAQVIRLQRSDDEDPELSLAALKYAQAGGSSNEAATVIGDTIKHRPADSAGLADYLSIVAGALREPTLTDETSTQD